MDILSSTRLDRELEAIRKRKEMEIGFGPAIDIYQYEIRKCREQIALLTNTGDQSQLEGLKQRILSHESAIDELRERREEWSQSES